MGLGLCKSLALSWFAPSSPQPHKESKGSKRSRNTDLSLAKSLKLEVESREHHRPKKKVDICFTITQHIRLWRRTMKVHLLPSHKVWTVFRTICTLVVIDVANTSQMCTFFPADPKLRQFTFFIFWPQAKWSCSLRAQSHTKSLSGRKAKF